jgi:hypothetical protein
MFAAWLQDADARACYGLTMAPDIFGSATCGGRRRRFPSIDNDSLKADGTRALIGSSTVYS